MESICYPCKRRDCVSKLTHWCSDCEDGLCDKCCKDHKVMKLTQRHRVIAMSEISVEKLKLLSIPQCEKHPECREDFICLDHHLVCCHACLKLDHNNCTNVSNVNVLSKGVSKSELFLSNNQTMHEVRNCIVRITEERRSAKECITQQQQRLKMQIANTKSKFIEHINNLENILQQELTQIEKENDISFEVEMAAFMKIDNEVEEDDKTLQFVTDNGSESQLFTFLKKQRRKQEQIIKMLEDIQPTPRLSISLEEATHEIKAIKAIGFLSVHYGTPRRSGISHNNTENSAENAQVEATETTPLTGSMYKSKMLKETLQIQLDPKDFVDRNEKYAKLHLQNVWIAVRDDNYLLIAGHVTILDQTENSKPSNYKNNYRLVKYVYDEKGLTIINGWNAFCDQYSESAYPCRSMNTAISCIPKSHQAVLLLNGHLNLINTESMERQWDLRLDHDFQALATDEKFIYITNQGSLFKYSRIGCLMESIKFTHCTSFAPNLKSGNFACQSGQFRWLKADGSVTFSYNSKDLKAVAVDNVGNIYLVTKNGIQVLDPVMMETEMVYIFDGKTTGDLMGTALNRDTITLFLLRKKQSERSDEFGQYGRGNKDISGYEKRDTKGYYVYDCPGCTTQSYENVCRKCPASFENNSVYFSEFTIQVLKNSDK